MEVLSSEASTPFYSTSDTPATPDDDVGPLARALSLSPKGVAPQRWFVDLTFHEIGLNPHPHIFYLNPNELGDDYGSVNIACSICFKQYDIVTTTGHRYCPGQTHHFHSRFESDSVVAECCQCGTSVNALLEQSTLPQSLIYRIQTNRRPKVNSPNLPHFHDTLDVLTRILQNAAKPESGSINTDSNMFKLKVGLDDSSKEFFQKTRFSLVDGRLQPPEYTPDNIQFLNRCLFQLQLVLLHEKPADVNGLIPAHTLILDRLGAAKYVSEKSEKAINLSEKASLLEERDSFHGKLGCVSNMTDELIIEAFHTQLSHDISASHPLVDALSEIQKKRKSERLEIEIICQRSEGIVTTAELKSAYRHFEIPDNGEGISTDVLLGLIRGSLKSGSKENLKIIAKARNDPELNQLLEQPEEDTQLDDPTLDIYYALNPVGLSNIGNTCYLNSLLQYMYTVNEIRETVLNMEAYIENEQEEGWKEKVIDGRTLTKKDVAEAKEIVIELNKLFNLMQTAKSRSVTPSNRLVELLLSTGGADNATGSSLKKVDQSFEQQDVSESVRFFSSETMAILMYRLSAAFQPIISEPGAKPIDRFSKLFYVKANKKIEEGEKRLIQEDFSTLLLNVKDDTSLEELMDDYFSAGDPEPTSPTTIAATEASAGSKNEKDAKAAQMSDITVAELPPILQIHLIRTQFDKSDQTSYKSNATVALPKRICLDQYLESNQEEHASRFKRMKLWKRERRVCRKVLEVVKNQSESQVLHQSRLPLSDNAGPNGSLPSDADAQFSPPIDAPKVDPGVEIARISELTEMLRNDASDLNAAEYKIHAVFHHEGGANFGHYWVYIYDDKAGTPRWLKYSDDTVSEVGVAREDEVFNGHQGSTACFCVYVRTSEPGVVQTVQRMIF
ncbi:ubiquitin-specific protease ubp2 [Linnemannia exigua]|uniref:ubiquitinyl hydrolase 1 n=1 Tax=Linnemannia exigua TaxID=604196 RepID=A0AAD4HCC1_9FUNG|nr:ubiquitin-specific protease ubp2 [Linnemannia exigua]